MEKIYSADLYGIKPRYVRELTLLQLVKIMYLVCDINNYYKFSLNVAKEIIFCLLVCLSNNVKYFDNKHHTILKSFYSETQRVELFNGCMSKAFLIKLALSVPNPRSTRKIFQLWIAKRFYEQSGPLYNLWCATVKCLSNADPKFRARFIVFVRRIKILHRVRPLRESGQLFHFGGWTTEYTENFLIYRNCACGWYREHISNLSDEWIHK